LLVVVLVEVEQVVAEVLVVSELVLDLL